MIISQTETIGQTLLLSTNINLHTAFPLAYLHLTLTHSKGQGHSDSTINISQTVTVLGSVRVRWVVPCIIALDLSGLSDRLL